MDNAEVVTVKLRPGMGHSDIFRKELAARTRLRFEERGLLFRSFVVTGPAFAVEEARAEIERQSAERDYFMQQW